MNYQPLNQQPKNENPNAYQPPVFPGQPYAGQPMAARPGFTVTPKPNVTGLDTLFAWLSILVGFFLIVAFPIVRNTLGSVLMLWVLFAFGAIYLVRSKIEIPKSSWIIAGIGAVFSLGLIFGANLVLQYLLFFAVLGLWLCFLYTACRLNGNTLTADSCFVHLIRALFVIPWASLENLFYALPIQKTSEKGKRVFKTVGWIFAGLGVAIIPTTVVILLLSYDSEFTALLNRIFDISWESVGEFIIDAIFGFGTTILLFGTMFGVKRRHNEKKFGKPANMNACHVMPKALLCATVTPILAVYVLFFVSQWDYYLSAFTGHLPENLTYANYARNGFFELCWIVAINAVLLLLFNLLMRRREGEKQVLPKLYSSVISLFTLILIATALSKMVLYIQSYGLTQKRVYATWLIVLLGIIFVMVLLKQFLPKMKLIFCIVAVCLLMFALIAVPNVDGMIADYNVDAYLAGDLTEVDVASLQSYGVSAVPALVELRDSLAKKDALTDYENEIFTKTSYGLIVTRNDLEKRPDHFFTFHVPTYRAKQLLNRV